MSSTYQPERNSLATNGDCGDLIYQICSLNHVGGGDVFCKKPFDKRIHQVRKLLKAQDYISDVLPWNGEHITHDVSTFRNGPIPYGVPLAEIHARWLKVSPDFTQPWLHVEPNPAMKGRIVVARTPRYQNKYFPWEQIVNTFRSEIVFIGHHPEHIEFCKRFGHVDHFVTKDLYEAAGAIAGCELFIGNQSSPNAICEAMKHRLIQETSLEVPDCIFPRDNAIHCVDGSLDFEVLGRTLRTRCVAPTVTIDTHVTPPGGWQIYYEGLFVKSYAFDAAINQLSYQLKEKGIEVPSDLRGIIVQRLSMEQQVPPYYRSVLEARKLLARLAEPV